MDFYRIMEDERKKQGISKYALAKKTGISQATFHYWEKGRMKMSLDSADKVFKALGISIAVTIGKESNE